MVAKHDIPARIIRNPVEALLPNNFIEKMLMVYAGISTAPDMQKAM